MRRLAVLAAGLVTAIAAPAEGADLVATSTPYNGVTHLVYEDSSIPARMHVVVVDLSSSEISLMATQESQRGAKLSEYSALSGAQVVINGDFFSPSDFRPAGLAMGAAAAWTGASDDAASGFLSFDRNGDRSHLVISPPEAVVALADLPTGTQGVVGGRPMLVRAGIAQTVFDCTDLVAMPCDRAPRTAVGISTDGTAMTLVVVDGWQAGSIGMTAAELGAFLVSLDVHDGLMLDGGAASALYIAGEGGIVSAPSDGVERTVANHLGVRFGSLPTGQLVGFIRERDIFDDTKNIVGATARLDNGDEQVTDSTARYNFTAVTPRLACVTASAPGYRTETSCKQVVPGETVYNSIALFPNSDFIDAAPGAPDAAVADAGLPPTDGAPVSDGGRPDSGMGGGGDGICQSGGDSGAGFAILLLAAALIARRRRVQP